MAGGGGWFAPGRGVKDDEVGTIRLYDFASGRLVALLKGHEDVVLGLAFSPGSRHLISGSADKTAIIWDTDSLSGTGTGSLSGAGPGRRLDKDQQAWCCRSNLAWIWGQEAAIRSPELIFECFHGSAPSFSNSSQMRKRLGRTE